MIGWPQWLAWLCAGYFIALHFGMLVLFLGCIPSLWRMMRTHAHGSLPQFYSGLEPPISVIVPASGLPDAMVARVQSLQHLIYAEYELVVVVESSAESTLQRLVQEFHLVPTNERFTHPLPSPSVRGVFRSTVHAALRVVEVEPAALPSELNAGLNHARFPLACIVKADLILRQDSLHRAVEPFLPEGSVIASVSPIGVANNCDLKEGFLHQVRLPRHPLPLAQVVENLRGAVFGRLGWNTPNAVLLTAPAFGLLDRRALIEIGGFRADTQDELADVVARLHCTMRRRGTRYRIVFDPEAVVARLAPTALFPSLRERARWQHGLLQSLRGNLGLLHPRCGVVGGLAFPFVTMFAGLLPLAEVGTYLALIMLWALTLLDAPMLGSVLLIVIGLGIIVSATAVAMEGVVLHLYRRPRHVAALLVVAVVEQFGFRQLCAVARLAGFVLRR